MDVMDWVILASMGVLVVFFASAAVMEWMERAGSALTRKSSSTQVATPGPPRPDVRQGYIDPAARPLGRAGVRRAQLEESRLNAS